MLSTQDLIPSGSLLLKLVIGVLIVLFIHATRQSSRPRNFPPGPPTVPLFGNLLSIPKYKQFLKYDSLSKTYGPILGLKFGSMNYVVFSNWKDVRELFDRRGTTYSSRPPNYIANLIFPGDVHLLLVQNRQAFQMLRKAVGMLLSINKVDKTIPILEAESTRTMVEILRRPAGYYNQIRRLSSSVILAAVYGLSGANWDNPNVKDVFDVDHRYKMIVGPGYTTPPIEVFPWVRYLPEFLAPWKAQARAVRRDQQALYSRLCNETKGRRAEGISPDCFMKDLLDHWENNKFPGMTWAQVVGIGGMMIEAGSDTSSATLQTFIFVLSQYPEVLRKAQSEVDHVCGASRSPTWNDAAQLPYVHAIMLETLRWRPVTPMALPHYTTEDDWYEGYLIPKGTTVAMNAWSIHRDEAIYSQPDEFVPERFMKNKFGVTEDDPDEAGRRVQYVFGSGRRACPGTHLAERNLIINMSKLIWAFDITAPVDPRTEKPVVLDVETETAWSDGLTMHPKEFPVNIAPRSARHAEILAAEYEMAEGFLRKYDT